MKWRLLRLAGVALISALALSLLVTGDRPDAELTPAADISQFNPGNIISDGMFFDGDAMSAADVDRFIQTKGLSCRTGSDGTPCLKDFRQSTTGHGADSYCASYPGGAGETAGTILTKVALACNVSPRVLLVVLQKEQGLVTSTGGSNLTSSRYLKAMGYACPDTPTGCDPTYAGFENQVYFAARRFQVYKANPTSYGYRAGRTQNILYQANKPECGSSPVYIQNQATANLYIYTPYQPNAAALAAGYGTGDACSAYGNRNFWLYFTDWFGSTQDPGHSAWQPIGHFDGATPLSGDTVNLTGWAVDPDTSTPIVVDVYVDQGWAGKFTANANRPDIGNLLPVFGANHGLDAQVHVSPGSHNICAWAINVGAVASDTWLGCLTVDTSGLPWGNLEQATVDEGSALVVGWTIDPDAGNSPTDVHVLVNGQLAGYGAADISRPDVAAIWPGRGQLHGFNMRVPLPPGDSSVCVYAINVPTPAWNPRLGCRTLHLDVIPTGWMETATGSAKTVTVTGWALDPETRGPIDVHAFVDGVDTATFTAGDIRTDIGQRFPALGSAHGFTATFNVAPGIHEVCGRAQNIKQGPTDVLLGCQTVNVGAPPMGHLDRSSVNAFQTTVSGWALDPDTADPVVVEIWVDGRRTNTFTADGDRPDIAAAFPGAGAAHGFTGSVPLSSGRHQICAVAVNAIGGKGDAGLGCATADVAGGQLPTGQLDLVRMDGGIFRASGWTFDPDAPTMSIPVQFTMDGARSGLLTANEDRPDVAAYYPGVGPAHGYTGSWILAPGWHTVCAYGINKVYGNSDSLLGCRVIVTP